MFKVIKKKWMCFPKGNYRIRLIRRKCKGNSKRMEILKNVKEIKWNLIGTERRLKAACRRLRKMLNLLLEI